jgi:hypothetical protein
MVFGHYAANKQYIMFGLKYHTLSRGCVSKTHFEVPGLGIIILLSASFRANSMMERSVMSINEDLVVIVE